MRPEPWSGQANRTRRRAPKTVLRLPDLDQAKSAVLNSHSSIDAQRGYRHAIDELMTTARRANTSAPASAGDHPQNEDILALCRREADELPDFGAGEEGDLLRDVAARVCARIDPAGERAARAIACIGKVAALRPPWNHLAATMKEHFCFAPTPTRTPAQGLMELELSVALMEAWTRVAELDFAMAECA